VFCAPVCGETAKFFEKKLGSKASTGAQSLRPTGERIINPSIIGWEIFFQRGQYGRKFSHIILFTRERK
jgi:hypothetical protein